MNNVTMEINGVPYTGFTQMRVTKSAIDFCGRFSFMTVGGNFSTANIVSEFPIKVGQSCKIAIDDETIINGFVETLNINYSENNHTIRVSGRDRTCDIVDSTLATFTTFVAPISLIDITKNVLKTINITKIGVTSNTAIAPFKAGDIIAGEYGISAFDYIEKYAKKRQFLATTTGDGNILFQQTKNQNKYNSVFDLTSTAKATILGASVTYDTTGRFNKYTVVSQSNDAALDGIQYVSPKDSTNINSNIFDKDIRPSRVYAAQSDATLLDSKESNGVAKWEANFKRSQSFAYDIRIQGFHPADDLDKIWEPNNLIDVKDDFADINATLLISDVVYSLSIQDGATTELRLVTQDAFTLEVNRPQKDADDMPLGDEYTQVF